MVLCELAESCYSIPATANELIEQSIRFMEEHITESVSLDEIAAHINLSKYYFNRLFSKHIGMTPHRYFTNLRIQRAKRLLMTTSASVEEVSAQCGFDNSSNFIRVPQDPVLTVRPPVRAAKKRGAAVCIPTKHKAAVHRNCRLFCTQISESNKALTC